MSRTRTRVLVGAALVVVIAMVIVAVAADGNGGDDDGGDRGEIVDTDAGLTIGSRTAPYRIVYRLDDLSDEHVEPGTDEIWVRQPFESRLETTAGSEVQTIQISAVDRLRLGAPEAPLVVARVPGLAVSDIRLAPVLDDGIDAGLLELREQRLVAGRRCQVVRSGTLLGAGPLVPATDDEHADTCVDAEGLLLEEVLYRLGQPTLHRIAVEVDPSPSLTDDLFDAGDITLPVDQGGGSSRPVDPDVGAEGPFWTLPGNEPPDGFTRLGRFGIIPPQPQRFEATNDPAIVAGTADVFVDGADFVVIYQGGTLGQVDAFAPTLGAPPVDGGALGDGEQLLSALGTELRFPQPHGRFVHVIGTLTPDDLLATARAMTETAGTGLVYLDG